MTREHHSLIISRCLAHISALKIKIVNRMDTGCSMPVGLIARLPSSQLYSYFVEGVLLVELFRRQPCQQRFGRNRSPWLVIHMQLCGHNSWRKGLQLNEEHLCLQLSKILQKCRWKWINICWILCGFSFSYDSFCFSRTKQCLAAWHGIMGCNSIFSPKLFVMDLKGRSLDRGGEALCWFW